MKESGVMETDCQIKILCKKKMFKDLTYMDTYVIFFQFSKH